MASTYPAWTTAKDALGDEENGGAGVGTLADADDFNALRRRIERLEGNSDVDETAEVWINRYIRSSLQNDGDPTTETDVVPLFVEALTIGPSQSPYSRDTVYSAGFNVGADGVLIDDLAHGCAWRQEYMYNPASDSLWVESHFEIRLPTNGGNTEIDGRNTWRPFAITADIHAGGSDEGNTNVTLDADKFSFNDRTTELNVFQIQLYALSMMVGTSSPALYQIINTAGDNTINIGNATNDLNFTGRMVWFTITDHLVRGNMSFFDTTNGTKLGTTTAQKIGFWNATPVVQPATTGTSTGFTANSGTAVNDASTFTGGTGTKAYRVSDIVLALKQCGIMAAS